ncbi:uncharacterized protein [Euphorbia lathyris]|uniref:uncharacterized protein n=1 Tax=Euphorbia lathyris TaxID=212925 RepID=UPI003313EB83
MYVTRPLSLYRKHPSALAAEPPEGPFTGYLVITDDEAEADDTYCFGACKRRRVKKLPFPQDKILNVVHSSDYQDTVIANKLWFLPVLDLPLSSNCYYVIKAKGRFKGQACICSGDMDMGLCCFKKVINDRKPKPLDPRNINQKFKIHRHYGHSFFAKSIAPYGHPPKLLRNRGWEVKTSRLSKCNFQISEALGLDASLRTQLPSFDFPISTKKSPSVLVGTWYCPFVFIRENARIREQMRRSMLYKMTLEQHWEEIYTWENVNNNENSMIVIVNANVEREVDYVFGREGRKDVKVNDGGFIWYRGGRGLNVGLSYAIVEKMKMVEEEGGWVDDVNERNVRIERRVHITSENGWRKLSCFVLVETFVLRRMDGTLVLKCDFRHTHQIKSKCE